MPFEFRRRRKILIRLLVAGFANVFAGVVTLHVRDVHDDETEIGHHFHAIFMV